MSSPRWDLFVAYYIDFMYVEIYIDYIYEIQKLDFWTGPKVLLAKYVNSVSFLKDKDNLIESIDSDK